MPRFARLLLPGLLLLPALRAAAQASSALVRLPAGYSWLVVVLAALLAAAGGAVVGWLLGKRQASKLRHKVEELRKQLKAMQQERDNLFRFRQKTARTTARPPAAPTPPTAQPPAAPAEAAPVAAAEATLTASLAVISAPPTAPQVLFAALRANAFLEDSQLRPETSPNYPLKITLDAHDPKSARFELNPGADQVTLIEYRLELLREYFTFALPTGRPSALQSRQPGIFTREADGWRVHPTQKGELDVR